MEMIIEKGSLPQQIHVTVRGEWDLYQAPSFYNKMAEEVDLGARQIELDMKDVSYLDSSGVGSLIRLVQLMRLKKGKLKVKNLSGSPKKVLELSNIISLLDVEGSC